MGSGSTDHPAELRRRTKDLRSTRLALSFVVGLFGLFKLAAIEGGTASLGWGWFALPVGMAGLMWVVQVLVDRRRLDCSSNPPELGEQKNLWLDNFPLSLLLAALLFVELEDFAGGMPWRWCVLPVGMAGVMWVVQVLADRRRLDCSSDTALLKSWRSQFMLRVFLAWPVLFAGAWGAGQARSMVPYLVGLVAALPGLFRARPTSETLAGDDRSLGNRGCSRSLVALVESGRTSHGLLSPVGSVGQRGTNR